MVMTYISDNTKHVVDAISVGTIVATIVTWLPPLAALLSIIWTSLRIWEMFTGKPIADRRKETRQQKKKKDAP